MAETYTIVIAENGYVITRSNGYDGSSGDVQIASDGELEVQLKAFRVANKLNETLKYVPGTAHPPPKPVPDPMWAKKHIAAAQAQAQMTQDMRKLLDGLDYKTPEKFITVSGRDLRDTWLGA